MGIITSIFAGIRRLWKLIVGSNAKLQKPHLLSIPLELRLEIYEHVFDDLDFSSPGDFVRPGLVNCCPQIRHESLRLYRRALKQSFTGVDAEMIQTYRVYRVAAEKHSFVRTRDSFQITERLRKRVAEAMGFTRQLRRVIQVEMNWVKKVQYNVESVAMQTTDQGEAEGRMTYAHVAAKNLF